MNVGEERVGEDSGEKDSGEDGSRWMTGGEGSGYVGGIMNGIGDGEVGSAGVEEEG